MDDRITFEFGPGSAQEVIQWAAAHGWHAWWNPSFSSENRGGVTPENVQIDDGSVEVPFVGVGDTVVARDGRAVVL